MAKQQRADSSEARERVLDAAERLFAQKGYASVTLRDIGAEIGIRHASLYHHVPGGKEQLFIEVTERTLQRHRDGLTQAIIQSEPNIRSQLRHVAEWLLSQPPMDLIRMTYSDMPVIDHVHAQRLSLMAYDALLSPIEQVLEQAQRRGEIRHHNLGLIAGGLVGVIESMYSVPEYVVQGADRTRKDMAYDLIDVFLDGIRLKRNKP